MTERKTLGYYEIKKTADNQYHFVLRAGNHEIILQSETYTTKESALNGIRSIQHNGSTEDIRDLT